MWCTPRADDGGRWSAGARWRARISSHSALRSMSAPCRVMGSSVALLVASHRAPSDGLPAATGDEFGGGGAVTLPSARRGARGGPMTCPLAGSVLLPRRGVCASGRFGTVGAHDRNDGTRHHRPRAHRSRTGLRAVPPGTDRLLLPDARLGVRSRRRGAGDARARVARLRRLRRPLRRCGRGSIASRATCASTC